MLDGLLGMLSGASGSAADPAPPPPDPGKDRELLFQVLFGRAAPSANRVIGFLGTTRGQQILGVTTVAAGAVLIPRVMR